MQFSAIPLRGGAAWPGIDTQGGKLDDGSGQLTLNSKNVMINRADTLEKRKGFVRGLDEQFTGVVCGLHKYTSECGLEYLLVADQSGILVRTPFAVPVFETSDAYPVDDFPGDSNTINATRWRDPSLGYQHVDGLLRIKAGAPNPVVWFKDATNQSYKATIDVEFLAGADQTVCLFIKSAADSGNGSLRLDLHNVSNTIIAILYWVNSSGTATQLATDTDTTFASSVRAVLSYNATTRLAEADIFASGNPLELSATLTAVQDAALGQQSMLQLVGSGVFGVDQILGEPI